MPYREKVQWVTLSAMVIVWGGYFGSFFADLLAGRAAPMAGIGDFLTAVALLVLIQVLGTIAVALYRPSEAEHAADVREREIAQRAAASGYHLLMLAGCVILLSAPLLLSVVPAYLGQNAAGFGAMLLCNALLAALVLAAVLNCVVQLFLYRRQG